MSIFYSTVARNPLVPELMPSVSGLSAEELALYARGGHAIHAAGIWPKRRDFATWQSMEPVSWNSNNPTDSDAAAVGLDAGLALGFYIYVVPGAVGLRDLAPDGVQALDDDYLTDGSDRWVVLAHGLDPDEDLKIGGVGDAAIKTSFEILVGDVVTAPTVGAAFVGTGGYSRWLSRHSDSQEWTLGTSKPTAAAILAGWNEAESLLDHFEEDGRGGLIAKHDRIAYLRCRREDLPEDWEDGLTVPAECGAPLVAISPSFITIFFELPKAVTGAAYGVRLVDLPSQFRRFNGDAPPITVARAYGQNVHMDAVPGTAGTYLYHGGGAPIRLLDRGFDARGVMCAAWPPAPLPTPIS